MRSWCTSLTRSEQPGISACLIGWRCTLPSTTTARQYLHRRCKGRSTKYLLRPALAIASLVIQLAAAAASLPIPSSDVIHMLAPTGELRVALYVGTPTSILSPTDRRGVGYQLGHDLAEALGVPYRPIIFSKNSDVLAAIKTATADVAFTNASPERALDMDFTQAYLAIELGYLAAPKTAIETIAAIDRSGVKVGVTAKSSSDGYLSSHLSAATVVRVPNFDDGIRLMTRGYLDVYATNKASLFEMAEKLPGAHMLAGNWGEEQHGIAIPKGRDAALPFLRSFVTSEIDNGRVAEAIKQAGLRGTMPPVAQ